MRSVFSRIMRPADGVAWVTGASSGIGRATALRLAADGWTVFATARRTDRLEALAQQASGKGHIIPMPGDVTDPARMKDIIAKITETNTLALAILNAGIYMPMRAQAFSATTAKDMIDVNLGGVCNALDPVLATMIAQRSGHVAVMASIAGYRGLPGAAPYSASKAGLIALCEALAMDLVRLGVRISVVNPGFVDTDATAINDFKMPFLMTTEKAANRVVRGLKRPGFEIRFPRRFALILRIVGLLPNRAYIRVIRAATGWK